MREVVSLIFVIFAAHASDKSNIDWFDPGQAHSEESYLVIDDCFVPVKTKYLKDLCYVQTQIKKVCLIDNALGEKCD